MTKVSKERTELCSECQSFRPATRETQNLNTVRGMSRITASIDRGQG